MRRQILIDRGDGTRLRIQSAEHGVAVDVEFRLDAKSEWQEDDDAGVFVPRAKVLELIAALMAAAPLESVLECVDSGKPSDSVAGMSGHGTPAATAAVSRTVASGHGAAARSPSLLPIGSLPDMLAHLDNDRPRARAARSDAQIAAQARRFIAADDAMSHRDWGTFEYAGLDSVAVEYERLRDFVGAPPLGDEELERIMGDVAAPSADQGSKGGTNMRAAGESPARVEEHRSALPGASSDEQPHEGDGHGTSGPGAEREALGRPDAVRRCPSPGHVPCPGPSKPSGAWPDEPCDRCGVYGFHHPQETKP